MEPSPEAEQMPGEAVGFQATWMLILTWVLGRCFDVSQSRGSNSVAWLFSEGLT